MIDDFDRIYEENIHLLEILANSFFIPGGDRDDIMQEATIGLIKACKTYDNSLNVPFGAYAYTCAKRQIITAIKKATSAKMAMLNGAIMKSDEIDLENMITDSKSDYMLIEKETSDEIIKQLSLVLSEFEKDVFKYLVSGYSYIEISKILNVSAKTTDNTVQRIRRKTKMIWS